MTTSELQLHGKPVQSVFNLLGDRENDLSFSLGWGLARSQRFLHGFLASVTGRTIPIDNCTIRLQHHGKDHGFTDIEIAAGNVFCIVEAKLGWTFPSKPQLCRYLPRIKRTNAKFKYIVSLSGRCKEEAESRFPPLLRGIPRRHISWKEIVRIARAEYPYENHAGKRLLNELADYLETAMNPKSSQSNKVFVVSLSHLQPKKWNISWIDVIRKKHLYFYPYDANGWPKEPPNYVAFRYSGRLQSIHHIQNYERVIDMHKKISEIPTGKVKHCFLCQLGPAFTTNREVRTGAIYRNGRVWCFLDTLFTSKTISEARKRSAKREQ